MPGKKKKFIDKKSAVSFHLVHRSQRDPLQADEEAPQHVLLQSAQEDLETQKEEEQKFGIFYDDEYNYLQHLKDVEELHNVGPMPAISEGPPESGRSASLREPTLQLPSTVFASDLETDVGLLNKAAPLIGPQLDWDPDIVAGLDEDFDYDAPDNQLDDDFVIRANTAGSDAEEGEEERDAVGVNESEAVMHRDQAPARDGDQHHKEEDFASDEAEQSSDDDDDSDVGSFGDGNFDDVETKTRFTSYSMTSSVIRRNEGLTLLDDRFEKLFEQYDDEEIGALDQDDIDGHLPPDSQVLNSAIQEFEEHQKLKEITLRDVIQKAAEMQEDSDSGTELVTMEVDEAPKEKWDCESILSTYSNLYNHPKTITEPRKVKPIKLTKRAEIPAEVLPKGGPTKHQLELEDRTHGQDRVCTYRPKDESSDERKARKQEIKAERKGRREEKKQNTLAFKEEKRRQEKDLLNVQKDLAGIKMS